MNHLLNADQIIQIGDYIYKLNKETEKVYVLPSSELQYINDLKSENTRNNKIKVYSTNDEVIPIVEQGIFCNAGSANPSESTLVMLQIPTHEGLNTAYVNFQLHYLKLGLYHRILADVKIFSPLPENFKVYVAVENSYYKVRCGANVNVSHPWMNTIKLGVVSGYETHRTQIYGGIKKLERFNIKARGRVEDWNNTAPADQTYTTYFTDWVNFTAN